MKYNQEISNLIFNSKKIVKNKDKTIIAEEDQYNNKNNLLRTEEFKNGINKFKEEFELNGYKPNVNRAKNLLNLNSQSKTINLSKPINFQNKN